jgi:sulfur relay (sulfurtransferase) DsrF/TusC family protein
MKIAYVFVSPRAASYKLAQMILPQLEAGTMESTVVGMFFFDDNVFVLRAGTRSASGSHRWRRPAACC